MSTILDQLVIGRTPYSKYKNTKGETKEIRECEQRSLPNMAIRKGVAKYTKEDQDAYENRQSQCRESDPTELQFRIQELNHMIKRAQQLPAEEGRLREVDDDEDDADGHTAPGQDLTKDEQQEDLTTKKKVSLFNRIFALCTAQVLHGTRGWASAKIVAGKDSVNLPSFLKIAYAGGRGGDPGFRGLANYKFKSDEDVLEKALWGAPILREALRIIHDTMNKPAGHKKALVLFHLPRSAAYFYKMLAFMGVDVRMLDAKMSPRDRGRIFKTFNTDKDDIQVLSSTYSLNLAGLNGHNNCSTVICCEPAFNIATEQQAYYRVRRWGQTEKQNFYRLFLGNSYMLKHEMAMATKIGGISLATGALHAVAASGAGPSSYLQHHFGGAISEEFQKALDDAVANKRSEFGGGV